MRSYSPSEIRQIIMIQYPSEFLQASLWTSQSSIWVPPPLHLQEEVCDIEKSLRWPQGTLEALQNAFQNNLTRYGAWDLDKLSSENQIPYRQASQVYKRGVPVKVKGRWQAPHTTFQKKLLTSSSFLESLEKEDFKQQQFIILDPQVARCWPQFFKDLGPRLVILPVGGEQIKNLHTIATILEAWRQKAQPLSWTIVGGGVTLDIAGFAAGLVGAQTSLWPTTLLSMVDASLGGKTGVNFSPYGKNQVGLFHFPHNIHLWPGWLKTLPPKEFLAGVGECLKHYFIDPSAVDLEDLLETFTHPNKALQPKVIKSLYRVKEKVVLEDPTEAGKRVILNLGHTLAHSLEALSLEKKGNLLHGEAVTWGLAYSFFVSKRLGLIAKSRLIRLLQIIDRSGCFLPLKEIEKSLGELFTTNTWKKIRHYIGQDKKNQKDSQISITMVLIKDSEELIDSSSQSFTTLVENQDLEASWEDLIQWASNKKEVTYPEVLKQFDGV